MCVSEKIVRICAMSGRHAGRCTRCKVFSGGRASGTCTDAVRPAIMYGKRAGATILPGVCVGKHAIVGAGSVVTKDIPDYGVAAGNPAKVIRMLDPEKFE